MQEAASNTWFHHTQPHAHVRNRRHANTGCLCSCDTSQLTSIHARCSSMSASSISASCSGNMPCNMLCSHSASPSNCTPSDAICVHGHVEPVYLSHVMWYLQCAVHQCVCSTVICIVSSKAHPTVVADWPTTGVIAVRCNRLKG